MDSVAELKSELAEELSRQEGASGQRDAPHRWAVYS
jgi:hypothetical protein